MLYSKIAMDKQIKSNNVTSNIDHAVNLVIDQKFVCILEKFTFWLKLNFKKSSYHCHNLKLFNFCQILLKIIWARIL
jgi:hypothetical protein